MSIITNRDIHKLRMLYERYGYVNNKLNLLYESFDSSILRTLNDINAKTHYDVDDASTIALSKYGMDFLLSMPIPWDKIDDSFIEVYYNRSMVPFMPKRDGEEFTNNTVNRILNKTYKDEYEKVKFASYLKDSSLYKRDAILELYNDCLSMVDEYTKKTLGLVSKIGVKNPETKNNAYIDSNSIHSALYQANTRNREADRNADYAFLACFLRTIVYGSPVDVDAKRDAAYATDVNRIINRKHLDELLFSNAQIKLFMYAKTLYDSFCDTDSNGDVLRRWGIDGQLRIREDRTDGVDNIGQLRYPTYAEIINEVIDKNDEFKRVLTPEIITSFYSRGAKNSETEVPNCNYFCRNLRMFLNSKIKDADSNDEFSFDDETFDKKSIINAIIRAIMPVYRSLRNQKKSRYAGLIMYADMYKNAKVWKESNNSGIRSSVISEMKNWYNDKNRRDAFSIVILTDKEFGIRYILSCISFSEGIGYSIDTNAVYGWKLGDTPEDLSKEIERTSPNYVRSTRSGKQYRIYNYSFITEDIIKNDNDISCAIFINSDNKDMTDKKTNIEILNENIRKALQYNLENGAYKKTDDNGIEVTDNRFVDSIKSLLDNEHIGYEIDSSKGVDGHDTYKIRFTDFENQIDKISSLFNTISNNDLYSSNGLSDICDDLSKNLNILKYFDADTEYGDAKTFWNFYCANSGGKLTDGENIDVSMIDGNYLNRTARNNILKKIEDYNSGAKKTNFYMVWLNGTKDTGAKRIEFDGVFKNLVLGVALEKVRQASMKINEYIHLSFVSLNSKELFKGFDVNTKGSDIIYTERLKRMTRRNISDFTYNKREESEDVKFIESSSIKLNTKNITTATKLFSDVYAYSEQIHAKYPFTNAFSSIRTKVCEMMRYIEQKILNTVDASQIDEYQKLKSDLKTAYNNVLLGIPAKETEIDADAKKTKEDKNNELVKTSYNIISELINVMDEIKYALL